MDKLTIKKPAKPGQNGIKSNEQNLISLVNI